MTFRSSLVLEAASGWFHPGLLNNIPEISILAISDRRFLKENFKSLTPRVSLIPANVTGSILTQDMHLITEAGSVYQKSSMVQHFLPVIFKNLH
jgi:hypothetical protein